MGCEIWKYNDYTGEWKRVVGGLGDDNSSGGFGDSINEYPWSMEVFDGYLYVGTLHPDQINAVSRKEHFLLWLISIKVPSGSGEIWRYDGTEWGQVVGDNAYYRNINNPQNGFGDEYNMGFRKMKVFEDKLVVPCMNLKSGCEVHCYN